MVAEQGKAESTRKIRGFFWCVILALGALQTWAHRNEMNPDGISYIEMAWATARGGLHQVVNAYWSPLYPVLMSWVYRMLRPAPQWDFAAAHLLNFVVYGASLAAFEFFLKELRLQMGTNAETSRKSEAISPRTFTIWAYVFFIWASCYWLGTRWVTPDLCVAAVMYLAIALLFRIKRGGGLMVFVVLGVVLGLGYLAKAAMFPLAFVFLLCALGLRWKAGASVERAIFEIAVASVIFAAMALPLVLALSAAKGRITFGDSGRIAYTEYIDGAAMNFNWQGEDGRAGTPLHPTRKILSDPAVYEFAQPIAGSYPVWYDPSYWYEGVRPHFQWKGELRALWRSANMYLKIFSKSGALWVVLLTLVVAQGALVMERVSRGTWLAMAPLFVTLAMYAIVLVEFRYIGPVALMLLLWTLNRIRWLEGAPPLTMRRVKALVWIAPLVTIAWFAGRDLYDVARNKPYEEWEVARGLHEMGIAPGTSVGSIGSGSSAYWAHLAGVRVIVEVPDKEQANYVLADTARRQEVLALFTSAGAKAVVTKNAAAARAADGWRQIPGTQHYFWQPPLLIAAPEKNAKADGPER